MDAELLIKEIKKCKAKRKKQSELMWKRKGVDWFERGQVDGKIVAYNEIMRIIKRLDKDK